MCATEVCKVLRLHFSPLELPILLATAHSGEAEALAALEQGVNDFLLKPLRLLELQARINSQLLVKQSARREAEARSHYELLAQVLPSHIIHRLAVGQAYAPEHHEQVTILFSDIVGFTELCSRWTTQEVVVLLDALFSSFDDICDRHGVFKVETIGDAYMISCGHDCSTRDHALRMAAAAVDMLTATEEISQQIGSTVQIRIGMHTGDALSGVVGKRRPRYCFFGDTVNVASRMESSGYPMTIHPFRGLSPFQCAAVKPPPRASDSSVDGESRFRFKLPAAAASILLAVRSPGVSRLSSARSNSGGGLPCIRTASRADSGGTDLAADGRKGSGPPGMQVEGLPWELFDLGFSQVKGKGLMKTHLLKVRDGWCRR
ncbi:hypothetical protein OEZ86_003759 [Tetradesmus obliquus]|nr:hypothetical protein OEZ86_003759 [Tetradesmus obliquus]